MRSPWPTKHNLLYYVIHLWGFQASEAKIFSTPLSIILGTVLSIEQKSEFDNGNTTCQSTILHRVYFISLSGQLYGLEKFWAFLKYSRRQVDIEPKLMELLKDFKRLEDFRVTEEVLYFS